MTDKEMMTAAPTQTPIAIHFQSTPSSKNLDCVDTFDEVVGEGGIRNSTSMTVISVALSIQVRAPLTMSTNVSRGTTEALPMNHPSGC